MARSKGGTERPRGRPPGRDLPFSSETEAKAHLLKRGFTEEQLRVLVDVGTYAVHVATLMRAFMKDEPGRWLLEGGASNLLLRNKPNEFISGMFGAPPPEFVSQQLGPLVKLVNTIAEPLVLLLKLQAAVMKARTFIEQQPELWEAMKDWKYEEQFTAALILVTLERLGWPQEELTEADHLALALYIGVKPNVLVGEAEGTKRADQVLDNWNRTRGRAEKSLLPLLRQVLGMSAPPPTSSGREPAPLQVQQESELMGNSPEAGAPVSSLENPPDQGPEGQ
jgi:hypothetical protein